MIIEDKYQRLIMHGDYKQNYVTCNNTYEEWDFDNVCERYSKKTFECRVVLSKTNKKIIPLKEERMMMFLKVFPPVRMSEFIEDYLRLVLIYDENRLKNKNEKEYSDDQFYQTYNQLFEPSNISSSFINHFDLLQYITIEDISNDEYFVKNQSYKKCEKLESQKTEGFNEKFDHPYFMENILHQNNICENYIDNSCQIIYQRQKNYCNSERIINQIMWMILSKKYNFLEKEMFAVSDMVNYVYNILL